MKVSAVFLLVATSAVLLSASVSAKNIVCYFTSWTVYRNGNGQFDVDKIDPFLCTHIMFGFVGITNEGKINILDHWESDDDGLKHFSLLANLTQVNPYLKIMVSMGGWNEGSQKYSEVAADPAKRKLLAEEVVHFLEEHKFQGFDLDWEYPGIRDGSDVQHDPANFVELLKELKTALYPRGYILSAAVSGGVTNMDIAYDVPLVSELLDIINVMVYDFHGAFEPFVGHFAPLTASSKDDAGNATLNVKSGIQHWIDRGADPAKMHLGVGTYGRSFTLADPNNAELYAPTSGGGKSGPYTGQDGVLGYNEICELHSDWTYIWDDEQQVPHRVGGNQWVGYEDERSLALKVEYAKEKNLGGIMVWSFDTDDFRGICGSETYPLIRTIKKTLIN
ncbi:chitinase-3-like protein 1 [Anoplophora glabripennis]|uniref:chitinase-3-like protein 1 n=1 Tax=Anoplophora glabripennis TaxID=217634 RepID=UPI0008750A5F|nr:chitinase-3-like protein 1 [Anoplophora glabripennis]